MGLFSSLGGLIGGALGGPAGSILGSTAANFAGSLFSGSQAEDAAETSFNRSLGASNTSYQRAVADMRAANLNPILAYSQGGASTPTAQTADTSGFNELSRMGSNAISTARTAADIQNTQQQTRTGSATEVLQRQQAERERLNNEGLRALPPEWRAAATMASSTGLDAMMVGKGLKSAYKSAKYSSVGRSVRRGTKYIGEGIRDIPKLPSMLKSFFRR